MKPRKFLGPSIFIAVLLLLGSGVYLRIRGSGAESDEGASSSDNSRPEVSATDRFRTNVAIPVSGGEVIKDTLVISVTAAGQAVAWRESKILALVEGRIARLPVHESQRVVTGQTLLVLDTAQLALQVAEARARLDGALADFRERVLFDDQIEDEQIRKERRRVARAKSGVDQAEVVLQQRLLDLKRSRLTAPFPGRIANVEVVEGQWVRQGDEILTVSDLRKIKVEVQVLESEVGYLAPGRVAQVSFAAFPDEKFVGRIRTINPSVDRELRTARVTVVLDNPKGRILPGMYARVALEARRFPDRILVPRAAILERDRRTMLFVYQPDGSSGLAKWHYVTTGLANDSLVEIVPNPETDLVEPGQIVLTDGHYTLIHDAHVRLVQNVRAEGGRPN